MIRRVAILVLPACAPELPSTDTGSVGAIELWQHGERVTWTTDGEDVSFDDHVIAVSPEPFDLWVRGCEARIYASWDLSMLDVVMPIEDLSWSDSVAREVPGFHGYRTGAAPRDMDILFEQDAREEHPSVSLISEFYGARPDPERPGWCRQTIRHWWSERELIRLDSAPVSLMLWTDSNGNGLDEPSERFRWTLEP